MKNKNTTSTLPPAGWYPHPTTGETGYWDGSAWTDGPQDPAGHVETDQETQTESTPATESPAGLTPQQEIIDIDVPSHRSGQLHAYIMQALGQKPRHRIVTMTMATYGEYPLFYRVLVVIEYLQDNVNSQPSAQEVEQG